MNVNIINENKEIIISYRYISIQGCNNNDDDDDND